MNSEFKRFQTLVDENVLKYLPEIDEKSRLLYDSMEYSLSSGGKHIRSVLLLAAAEICSGSCETAIPYACAVEYIQTYSLIHDDHPCMDNDDYRRGKLTNHKVFGDGIAMLAGDGLLSAAYEVMSEDMTAHLDDAEGLKRRTLALSELSKGTGVRGMVAGQVADLQAEHKEVDADTLRFIHNNKTAAFIRSSVMAGAYIGGAGSEELKAFDVYGQSLGLAFQIVDDIQDVIGTKESRGKDVGGDAEAEKATYPALFGIEKSKEYAQELLGEARKAIASFGGRNEALVFVIDYLEQQIR